MRARLLWNRGNLFIAAEMDDGDLYADVTDHDGDIRRNAAVEFLRVPDGVKPARYEFHVKPANMLLDLFKPRRGHESRFLRAREFHLKTEIDMRSTLDRTDDKDEGWTSEIGIPWADLLATGGMPEPGDEWRKDSPVNGTSASMSAAMFALADAARAVRWPLRRWKSDCGRLGDPSMF